MNGSGIVLCAVAMTVSVASAGCSLVFGAFKPRGGWCYENELPVAYDRCNPFDAPKRFTGAWLYEFEASLYFDGKDAIPSGWRAYDEADAWLEADEATLKQLFGEHPGYSDCQPDGRCAVVVEFIGRRSSHAGDYGHMGGSERVILMDRIISVRRIEAPPSPSRSPPD